jgi:hypothetical protein
VPFPCAGTSLPCLRVDAVADARTPSKPSSDGDAILMQLLKDSGYDVDFSAFTHPAVAVHPEHNHKVNDSTWTSIP